MTRITNLTELRTLHNLQIKMQSELAYMSLEWARRNDSCGRLPVVQLSASLSSSTSGLTEGSNQIGFEKRNACLTPPMALLKWVYAIVTCWWLWCACVSFAVLYICLLIISCLLFLPIHTQVLYHNSFACNYCESMTTYMCNSIDQIEQNLRTWQHTY